MWETIDLRTRCVVAHRRVHIENPDDLFSAIGVTRREFESLGGWCLDAAVAARVAGTLGVEWSDGEFEVDLRVPTLTDTLPYEVHTRRELTLMLAGSKPLAAFMGPHPPAECADPIPEAYFAPHVAAGRFIRREQVEPDGKYRRVLYALPGHEWRIDAYLDLWVERSGKGWSNELERREGTLLGYTDEQNDQYIAARDRWIREKYKQPGVKGD